MIDTETQRAEKTANVNLTKKLKKTWIKPNSEGFEKKKRTVEFCELCEKRISKAFGALTRWWHLTSWRINVKEGSSALSFFFAFFLSFAAKRFTTHSKRHPEQASSSHRVSTSGQTWKNGTKRKSRKTRVEERARERDKERCNEKRQKLKVVSLNLHFTSVQLKPDTPFIHTRTHKY